MAGRRAESTTVPLIPETTTVADLALYRKALPPGHRGFFRPLAEPLVRNLRLIKDEDELRLMKQAAHLGVELFHELLPQLQPGMPETTVAALLEHSARAARSRGHVLRDHRRQRPTFGLAAWPRDRPSGCRVKAS